MLARYDDPIVIVPADVAAELMPYVRLMARGSPLRSRTLQILDELDQAASIWAASRESRKGQSGKAGAQSDPVLEVSSAEAGERLGVTRQRVGQLVGVGLLSGRKNDAGHLRVSVVSIEALRLQREEAS